VSTLRFASAALLVGLVIRFEPAYADTRIVEQVVARVDGQPILLSEIRARARPHLARARVFDAQKVYAEMLDQRIEEEVVRSLAAALHISVTAAELAEWLESIAKQYQRTADGILTEALAAGFTADEYRSALRGVILRQRVILAIGLRDKTAGPYPTDDAERTAWLARVENGAFAKEKRKACVERFVRW
jgi:peptidyl-prolyl cis-trans isomerase SurA